METIKAARMVMFVRWRRREKNNSDTHLAAILVESVHVDGRPRQRHIAYLSGITEDNVQSVRACNRFWGKVDKRLHGLSLTAQEHERIVYALAVKVRRPTSVETERSERGFPAGPRKATSRAIASEGLQKDGAPDFMAGGEQAVFCQD